MFVDLVSLWVKMGYTQSTGPDERRNDVFCFFRAENVEFTENF